MFRFVPFTPKKGVSISLCYEATVVFLTAIFQNVSVAIAYSISKPYKKPFYSNSKQRYNLITLYRIIHFIFDIHHIGELLFITLSRQVFKMVSRFDGIAD